MSSFLLSLLTFVQPPLPATEAPAGKPSAPLQQRLEEDRAFVETLNVTTTTRPPDNSDVEPVTSNYLLTLYTETGSVEKGKAELTSRVRSVYAEVRTPGGTLDAAYDSSKRQTFDSSFGDDADQSEAEEELRQLLSEFRDAALTRTIGEDGTVSAARWSGLVGEGDVPAMSEALQTSLTQMISVPMPTGRVEIWTEDVRWPMGPNGETTRVLMLLAYNGKNADGLERVKVSMAGSKEDAAGIVGRGTALFDRNLGRTVAVDLVVQANALAEGEVIAVTRTNVAWRLQPAPDGADDVLSP